MILSFFSIAIVTVIASIAAGIILTIIIFPNAVDADPGMVLLLMVSPLAVVLGIGISFTIVHIIWDSFRTAYVTSIPEQLGYRLRSVRIKNKQGYEWSYAPSERKNLNIIQRIAFRIIKARYKTRTPGILSLQKTDTGKYNLILYTKKYSHEHSLLLLPHIAYAEQVPEEVEGKTYPLYRYRLVASFCPTIITERRISLFCENQWEPEKLLLTLHLEDEELVKWVIFPSSWLETLL